MVKRCRTLKQCLPGFARIKSAPARAEGSAMRLGILYICTCQDRPSLLQTRMVVASQILLLMMTINKRSIDVILSSYDRKNMLLPG